jgi:hypothetical protein
LTIKKYDDVRKNYTLKDILIENKSEFDTDAMQAHLKIRHERFGPSVQRVNKAFSILGFIRFLKGFYIVLVTRRKRVAKIFRHSIYTVKEM